MKFAVRSSVAEAFKLIVRWKLLIQKLGIQFSQIFRIFLVVRSVVFKFSYDKLTTQVSLFRIPVVQRLGYKKSKKRSKGETGKPD